MGKKKRHANNNFLVTLEKVNKVLDRAKLSCETIGILHEKGDFEELYDECFKLARSGERIALHTRMLPAYTGKPGTPALVWNLILEDYPMEIGYTEEGWFGIRIPMLMPKKGTGQVNYLRDILYTILGKYVNEHRIVRSEKKTVMIFRHVYTDGRSERQWRDHDNFEVNMVSDVIAMYMLVDDSPTYCSHYHCSALGESECTEIYLVPKNEFSTWLCLEPAMPKEGCLLGEMP